MASGADFFLLPVREGGKLALYELPAARSVPMMERTQDGGNVGTLTPNMAEATKLADDVGAALLDWAPEGVDLLLDAVGQASLVDLPSLVRPGGRALLIETLIEGERLPDQDAAAARDVRIIRSSASRDNVGRQLAELIAAFGRGDLRAPPIETMPIARIAEGQEKVRTGHVRGKIVVTCGPEDWSL